MVNEPNEDAGSGQRNPFAASHAGNDEPTAPRKPSTDPSIEQEPFIQGYFVPPSSAEDDAMRRIAPDSDNLSVDDAVEHTVWDEPALTTSMAGSAPTDQLTYARWLEQRLSETTVQQTWVTTCWVAASAGVWGVVGALITQSSSGGVGFGGAMAAILLAPVTEEITKIAAALWVVEKRPFRFASAAQILFCAAAGGLAFAVIENLIYLTFYVPAHGPGYAAWRWIVCTALHVVCSTTAGVGLVRIWRSAINQKRRPELAEGMPWFAAAMILHGLYNTAVTLAEAAGLLTFD